MAQEFADALDEAGYDVIDVFDGNVAIYLQDVSIQGEEFDKMERTIAPDPALSDGPAFDVVDVWRADNALTDAHETVLEDVGTPDDGGAVYEVDAEELADSIRETQAEV